LRSARGQSVVATKDLVIADKTPCLLLRIVPVIVTPVVVTFFVHDFENARGTHDSIKSIIRDPTIA